MLLSPKIKASPIFPWKERDRQEYTLFTVVEIYSRLRIIEWWQPCCSLFSWWPYNRLRNTLERQNALLSQQITPSRGICTFTTTFSEWNTGGAEDKGFCFNTFFVLHYDLGQKSYDAILSNISNVVKQVPVYFLRCRADKEAAQLCYKTIARTSATDNTFQ